MSSTLRIVSLQILCGIIKREYLSCFPLFRLRRDKHMGMWQTNHDTRKKGNESEIHEVGKIAAKNDSFVCEELEETKS